MSGIACELAPLDEDPSAGQLLGPGVAFSDSQHGAAGTFMHGAGVDRALMSYAPSQVRNPDTFVATMAHELGHFLMHGFGERSSRLGYRNALLHLAKKRSQGLIALH
jgi:hypothetical protein